MHCIESYIALPKKPKKVLLIVRGGKNGMIELRASFGDGTLERLEAAQADIRDEYLAKHTSLGNWLLGRKGQHPPCPTRLRDAA